jgi:hypothetical protein
MCEDAATGQVGQARMAAAEIRRNCALNTPSASSGVST